MMSRTRRDDGRFLDPVDALAAAIDRLRGALPGRGEILDAGHRETLGLAAGDIVRALVHARRMTRQLAQLELEGLRVLDHAALVVGARRDGDASPQRAVPGPEAV